MQAGRGLRLHPSARGPSAARRTGRHRRDPLRRGCAKAQPARAVGRSGSCVRPPTGSTRPARRAHWYSGWTRRSGHARSSPPASMTTHNSRSPVPRHERQVLTAATTSRFACVVSGQQEHGSPAPEDSTPCGGAAGLLATTLRRALISGKGSALAPRRRVQFGAVTTDVTGHGSNQRPQDSEVLSGGVGHGEQVSGGRPR